MAKSHLYLGVNKSVIRPGVFENTEQIKKDCYLVWQLWQCQSGGPDEEPETELWCLLGCRDVELPLLAPVCLTALLLSSQVSCVFHTSCVQNHKCQLARIRKTVKLEEHPSFGSVHSFGLQTCWYNDPRLDLMVFPDTYAHFFPQRCISPRSHCHDN